MKQFTLLLVLLGMSLVSAQSETHWVVMDFIALGETNPDMGKTTAGLLEAHLSTKKISVTSKIKIFDLLPNQSFLGESSILELLKENKGALQNLKVEFILLGEISRIDHLFYGSFKLLRVKSEQFQEGFAGAVYGAKSYQLLIQELRDALDKVLPEDKKLFVPEDNANIPVENPVLSQEEKSSRVDFGSKKNRGHPKSCGEVPENAVLAGLTWLKNHQSSKGNWDADNFMTQCKGSACTGKGKDWTDMGQTALATLAFLGAGNSHRVGRFKDQVRDALKYMRENQNANGSFGAYEHGTHHMYNHAIATLAMAEAYEISGRSSLLKDSTLNGIQYLLQGQNPGLGWRYDPQSGDNDSSVTAWAVMALKAAQIGEIPVPAEAFQGAKNWYDRVTDDAYYRTGYMKCGDPGARLAGFEGKYLSSEAMTAAAMVARVFMKESPSTSPYIKGGSQLLLQDLPEWHIDEATGESKLDFYYWYFGTLAMFQVGGESWDIWNKKIKTALIHNQQKEGCAQGSWDAIDAWSSEGGRVYATAINTLTLEIYYRYQRILK